MFTGAALHVIDLAAHIAAPPSRMAGVWWGVAWTTRGTGVTVAIISTIVICAVGVFLAVRMRRGTNWARITLAVFALLELLTTDGIVTQATHGGPAALSSVVFAVLTGLAAIAFLATAFREAANNFFAETAVQ